MMYTDKQRQRDLLREFKNEMLDNYQSWEDFTKCRTNEQMQELKSLKEEIIKLKSENLYLESEVKRLKRMTFTQRFKMRIKYMLQSCVYKVINLLGSMTNKCYSILNKYLEV